MTVIYICDDEVLWLSRAKELISLHYKDCGEIQISCYNDPKKLLMALNDNNGQADILILDIDMPGMSGFETARMIREAYPDILLLFYTVHEQYVFESFQFQPFRYIRKSHAERELPLALSAADEVLAKRTSKSVILKTKEESCLVETKDIMWFETDRRRCDVHLCDGRLLNVGLTIKAMTELVNSPEFVMIHSGAAVNAGYITHYSGLEITLQDGTRLMVSRSRKNEVRQAVMKYWSSRI